MATARVPLRSERFPLLAKIWLGGPQRGPHHKRKPANLIYDVEDYPPLPVTLVLALQHVFVLSVGWIFAVVLVTGIGGTGPRALSPAAGGLPPALRLVALPGYHPGRRTEPPVPHRRGKNANRTVFSE